VRLPKAAHVRWDRLDERRVTLGVSEDGFLQLADREWFLRTSDGVERAEALAQVRAETVDPARLMLVADGQARWEDVRAVLRAALDGAGSPCGLEWAVEGQFTWLHVHQEALVTPPRALDEAVPVLEIHARPAGPWDTEVRAVLGEFSAVLEGREDARRILEQAGDPRSVSLRTFEESEAGDRRHVLWAHLVWVFDALLGGRARRVELPDLGVGLDLLDPDDPASGPFGYPDDPVATPVVVLLAVLAALAAFAATFSPLLLRRSARKRPRGS